MKNTTKTFLPTTGAAVILALTLGAPAHAEEPVKAIDPPYSTEAGTQAPGTITAPGMLAWYAEDDGLTLSGKTWTINGSYLSKTTKGTLYVGNLSDAYVRVTAPHTGAVIPLGPWETKEVTGTPAPGATHSKGAILEKYRALGGPDAIGLPTSNEWAGWTGRHAGAEITATQKFQTREGKTTTVVWTKSHGAHAMKGAIGDKYARDGGTSAYGAPTSDEYAYGDGARQDFERGSITWSKTAGARTLR